MTIETVQITNGEKAAAIIEHITYNVSDKKYDTDVFTAKSAADFHRQVIAHAERTTNDRIFLLQEHSGHSFSFIRFTR